MEIKKVRHLSDISISLAEDQIKHLILTGKNGSGKTSVLEALAGHLNNIFSDEYFMVWEDSLNNTRNQIDIAVQKHKGKDEIAKLKQDFCESERNFNQSRKGLEIKLNVEASYIFTLKKERHYILSYLLQGRQSISCRTA